MDMTEEQKSLRKSCMLLALPFILIVGFPLCGFFFSKPPAPPEPVPKWIENLPNHPLTPKEQAEAEADERRNNARLPPRAALAL